ncbi:hypothetical protein [Geotoga petraea]|jgi:hypothetical protein|uniref:Uncharacterized protein n=1 Tax=Geotoga petraea TaxID=28234 RepID=A0A4Z0W2B9_9BACT|nr:hypothetical protein [Geotoga petraea]MDK2946248.1 hypothetical protein [Geotoga sp.]TGG88699.1 hypothetical protein E4650_00400 [Geotoga petraea]
MSKDLLLFYKLKYSDFVFKLKNELEDNFNKTLNLEVYYDYLSIDTLDDLFKGYKFILFIIDEEEQDKVYEKFNNYKNYSERILFLDNDLKKLQEGEKNFNNICQSIDMKLKELEIPQNEYEYLIDQYKKNH